MTPSLQTRVDHIRRGARRIVWLHALGWVLAAVLATAMLAAGIDYLLRPNDLVLRSLLTLIVIAVLAWASKRWLLPAWQYRPSLLEIAQRIELRWPRLGGRLSSSIAFLSQSDDSAQAGSLALRRRVVAEAEAVSAEFDFRGALNPQPQFMGMAASGLVALVLVVLTALNGQTVALAAGRLALPWSSMAWPRWNHLQFANVPPQLARGQALELSVVDEQRRLPNAVTLQIHFDDGESLRQEMKFLAGTMVHRMENVSRSFRYRASGGDDDTMPWQRLDVVEPLKIEELSLVVHPPAYAGKSWPAMGAVFTMLEGSRLAISGRADQPLSSAQVQYAGSKDAIDVVIAPDRFGFSLLTEAPSPWQPKKAGTYILRLTSDAGVTTEQAFRWEVRLTADARPTVAIESPSDGAYATPQALLPVVGTAKDDLALAAIDLRFLRAGASDQQAETVPIWKAMSNSHATTLPSLTTGGQVQAFESEWDLQQIFGIQSGDVLSWFIEASDFRPQSAQTPAARLTIISPEEMQQRLVQRQASALSQLAEALNLQRETRVQVGTLEVQWNEVGHWRPRDRDLLHGADLHQRQVQSLVGRTSTGAATILAKILADLRSNRLDLPEMADRCTEILTALDRLEAERFPGVVTRFSDLLRETRQTNHPNTETKANLAALGKQQDAIAETVEALLGKLAEWDTFQRMRRDLATLRDEQRAVTASTQKLQAEVLTDDTGSQQQADARQLSRQQSELVRRFEKLQQRLAEFSQRPEGEQAAAQKAAAVSETASKLAIGAKMREAARAADELKLGQSLQSQQEVDRALAELLDALAGRLDGDNEKALQQLKDLAASLDTLEREQGELAKQLDQQAAEPEEPDLQRLENQQRKLEEQTNEIAKKLGNNQAGEGSQSAEAAASAMGKASESARRKKAGAAAEQAYEAQKKLQEAKRSVNEQIAQRQADLLREQMARLEQHINGLLVRQEAVQRETQRLWNLKRQQQNQLTAAQTASLADLAVEQEGLAMEARALSQGPQLPSAFSLQLEWTAGDMSSAATRLREMTLDDSAIAAQSSAIKRLQMILEAMQAASSAGDNKPDDAPKPDAPPMPSPPGDDAPPPDIHDLAEVKLLRAMQAEINRRTFELESLPTTDSSLAKRVAALADEQGRVAELALKLVQSLGRPKRPNANNSDAPPDMSDEDLLKKLDEALLPQ